MRTLFKKTFRSHVRRSIPRAVILSTWLHFATLFSPTLAQPVVAVQAVPANTQPDKQIQNAEATAKSLGRIQQEELSRTPIILTAKNASLEEVVKQVQDALGTNQKVVIEIRKASPIRLTFSLKEVPIGQILSGAASLAGCELHILPDHLLICPLSDLSPAERNNRVAWMPAPVSQITSIDRRKFSTNVSSTGNPTSQLHNLIVAEVQQWAQQKGQTTSPQADGIITMRVGNLSAQGQEYMQMLADKATTNSSVGRLRLTADTSVQLIPENGDFALRIRNESQHIQINVHPPRTAPSALNNDTEEVR